MKSTTLLLTSLIFIILLFGCSKQEGEDYFPFEQDSKYDYSVEYTSIGGVQKARAVSRIADVEEINGKRYYKEVTVYSGIPGIGTQINYYRKTKDGIYKINGKDKNSTEYLEIPFPLVVGKAWDVQEPEGTIHYKVEGIETVELIDRSYKNCLKISYSGYTNTSSTYSPKSFEGVYYSAEDIGMVRNIMKMSGITFDYILQSYEN